MNDDNCEYVMYVQRGRDHSASQTLSLDEMKWNDIAMILSVFENRLRAGLV